jgi:hypothetical protein
MAFAKTFTTNEVFENSSALTCFYPLLRYLAIVA